jgi:DNA-binding CsgD family transcriptional regulator
MGLAGGEQAQRDGIGGRQLGEDVPFTTLHAAIVHTTAAPRIGSDCLSAGVTTVGVAYLGTRANPCHNRPRRGGDRSYGVVDRPMVGPTTAALGGWPLVARDAELAACQRLLSEGSVVVAGQPGVGKTRLCRELAAWATASGWHVESAFGTRAGTDVPLAAMAPLLPDVGQVSNEALIRATLHHLRNRADGRPLLVTVDDGHLLDPASSTLLHLLVSSRAAAVAVTVTSGQPAPDPVTALWKDQLATRIELQALARRESAALLTAAFGCPLDPLVESRLWELSLGNSLFLRELVVSNIDAGALDEVDGVIRWTSGPVVAPRLQDLVEGRLRALSSDARSALETLALSEPLELDVLIALAGPDPVEVLERRQLLGVEVDKGRRTARLAHPVYGQVLRAALPTTAVARTYRALADALGATAQARPDDVLRLATWRLAAGDPLDKDLLSTAALHAWQLGQMQECERFARLAVDAGAGWFLAVLLAQSLIRQGRAEDAVELLHAQLADDDPTADRELLTCTLAASLGWGSARLEEAEALLRDGIGTPVEHPVRHATLAVTNLMQGRTDECIARAEAVLAATDSVIGRSYSLTSLATTVFGTGDLVLSERILASSDPRSADALLLPFAHVRKVSNHTCALVAQGRVREAIEFAAPHHQESVDDGDDTSRVRWGFVLGYARLVAGDIVEARALLADAEQRALRCEPVMGEMARPFVHLASTLLGRPEEASPEPGRWGFSRPLLTMAQAYRLPHPDDDGLSAAAEQAAACGWSFVELFIRYLALRHGALHIVDPLAAAAAKVGGTLAATMRDHARAAARPDAASLADCAQRYEAMGYRWFAADAHADAARVLSDAGRHAVSTTHADAARSLAATTGAWIPGLEASANDPLSAREREVATLVASGLTDKEVADALFLSVRTVNAHLRSIYQKLGINSRAELAAYAARK